jgi:hypothetical protein
MRSSHRGREVHLAKVQSEPLADLPGQIIVAVNQRMAAQQAACRGQCSGETIPSSSVLPTRLQTESLAKIRYVAAGDRDGLVRACVGGEK